MPRASTQASRVDAAEPRGNAWAFAASIAIAAPALIAYNLPPSATFFNQAAAVLGWGVWLVLLSAALARRELHWPPGLQALIAALALLGSAALASPLWTGQPWALSWSASGLIAAAAVTALVAAALQQAGHGVAAFRAFCIGLVVASVASSLIGLVQVLAPGWADGDLIARTAMPGRAVGNLRQPNHLCSLLLWGMVALVWLAEARLLRRFVAVALALLLMLAVVLSGSRSGVVGALLLALWGGLDRRLSRPARVALLLAPLAYALWWAGASAWAHLSQHPFAGETRFSGLKDISSSRFGIWANTLALIRAFPWFGVGFGEFNFAWTLTPFAQRPVAFFDHAHNLPLHLAAELGLPLAALVLGLLGAALWCAWRRVTRDGGEQTHLRAALMMVLMVLVHSLLEYPLWYAYFLLPTMFALGLGVGGADADRASMTDPGNAGPAGPATARPLLLAAMLMMLGAVAAVRDYVRVVVIFAPPEHAAPLGERIADGQHSWFFSHHADYAAVTTAGHPDQATLGWAGAPHYLLDARLMRAWAEALHDAGDESRARHVAQRLREFHNTQAKEFFEPCGQGDASPPAVVRALSADGADGQGTAEAGTRAQGSTAGGKLAADETALETALDSGASSPGASRPLAAPPFQCLAPDERLDHRDFR